MKYKLLIINSLYPNYIKSYYKKYSGIKNKSYKEQYQHILENATEMITSYTKTFNKIGIKTRCIIINAIPMQKRWSIEKKMNFNNNEEILLEQIKDYKPDILWIGNKKLINKKLIHKIKNQNKSIKLIFSYFCSPYSESDIENFKLLDFIITCTPGYKSDFKKLGINTYLSYHAFDKDILANLTTVKDSKIPDLIFTGSLFIGPGYHSKRIELLEKILEEGYKIKIYGNIESTKKIIIKKCLFNINKFLHKVHLEKIAKKIPYVNKFSSDIKISYSKKLKKAIHSPVFGNEMLEIMKSSKIVLNNHGEVAGNYAGNMRLFEVTGVGSCLLTDNKSNMPELFDITKEVVVYNNTDECINTIKWLLDNPLERQKIAKAGQVKTLSAHTIQLRCKLISDIINTELTSKYNG